MKTLKRTILTLSLLTIVLCGGHSAIAQSATAASDNTETYLELLRSDFNTNKIRTLNQVMKLTVPEAEKFWPIYRAYEQELAAVGDEKLALIREFMTHYRNGTLSDANAGPMAKKWLANQQARIDLWKKYNAKISKAVSPMRAAQFLQVENQMALFVDVSIASDMPVVAPSAPPSSTK